MQKLAIRTASAACAAALLAAAPAAAEPETTGGLPHSGFALASLVALGTGFLLTRYALRYSRSLDG